MLGETRKVWKSFTTARDLLSLHACKPKESTIMSSRLLSFFTWWRRRLPHFFELGRSFVLRFPIFIILYVTNSLGLFLRHRNTIDSVTIWPIWQSLFNVQHFLQKEVAKARNLVEGTIFGHLAEALKANYPVDYKRGADILCIGKDEDKWAVKIEKWPGSLFSFFSPSVICWYEMWTSSFNLCRCIHHENV